MSSSMTSPILNQKRTRSQLTLPDQLIHQLGSRSPLKHARAALRNSCDAELQDELLLSPRKNALSEFRAPKRSASPTPVHQPSSSPDSSSTDRGSKRLKRDADRAAKSSHTRSISQPDTTNANIVSNTSELPSNARAQSAPLFASSSSSTMPHIDFRNPPPSPRRARSRSPSKEPGLRILSGPSIFKLDTIPDEPNPAMKVDPDDNDLSAPSHPLPDVSDARSVTAVTPDIQEAALDKLPIPSIVKPPSTPATQRPTTLFSMSPLTPISETPFPPNFMASCRDRCTGPACFEEEEEQVQAESSGLPLHLPKLFPSVKPHTKYNPLTSATTNPPQPSSSSTNIPTNKINPSGPKPTNSGRKDAFVFLMDNARHKKDAAKGKAISTKAGSSSSIASKSKSITTSTPSKEGKVKANVKGKEVAQETPQTPKVSLKAKMKPKTTPKAKPVPVPIPHPNDEPEAGDRSLRTPSPRLPNPAEDTAPLRPATLVPMDVSMQPINPSPLDAHEIPHYPQTSPKTHDAETSETLAPDSLSERPPEAGTGESIANEGLIVNVLPEASAMPPPPPANKTDEITNSETIIPPEDSEISALPLKPVPKKKTGNKRLPNAVPVRVTRSVSSRQNNTRVRDSNLPSTTLTQPILGCKESPSAAPTDPSSTGTKLLPRFTPAAARNDSGVSTSSLSDLPTDPIMDPITDPPSLPPGLPMKVESHSSLLVRKRSESSFARPTLSTTAKQTAPSKTPAKPLQFRKPGTPSPSKIARSASMHTSRPSGASRMSRTFSSYTSTIGAPSSLSTLSSALEKLRMPPPGRPNTSMGFNRDVGSDDGPEGDAANTTSKDDIATEKNKPGPRPSIGASSVASGSQLVQRTLTGGKASTSSLNAVRTSSIYGRGAIMRGPGGFKVPGTMRVGGAQPKIFGVGGRAFAGAVRARAVQKASRKTSLPSVIASPVKGSGAGDDDDDVDMDMGMGMPDVKGDASGSGAHVIMEWNGDASTEPLASDVGSGESAKGKEKERRDAWKMNASRRVSLASRALSQSLSDLPTTNGKEPSGLGVMGPPATPVRDGRRSTRSASSSYPPSQAGSTAVATPDVDDSEKSPRTRSVTRSLMKVDKMQEVGGGACHASGKKASVGQESLKILDGCVIFVDVRNDDRDEVGSLFVEMLEGVGARILTRVGQTCTHIVFKNGLMSTLRRYRLLRDPKPLVVGIAWVVECVEQMKHVNENKFLIDLDGVNVSGTNKRRRSMLPKLISRSHDEGNSSEVDHDGGDGDVSLDGSTSSLMLDDNLTPLEKARRRKGKT